MSRIQEKKGENATDNSISVFFNKIYFEAVYTGLNIGSGTTRQAIIFREIL